MNKTKDERLSAKYVHVTLHKLTNNHKDYWLDKGMAFRSNVVACLVGLEENHEEGKGLHAHIVIQFSTKQKLSRDNFVKHFGTDTLHIATKPNKDALLMALGYVSKTGNVAQKGIFTHRGIEIDTNPEVYRFNYSVKNVADAMAYFRKVICENLDSDVSIIKSWAEHRKDDIGDWLRRFKSHKNTLIEFEYGLQLEERNKQKRGFEFQEFVNDKKTICDAYKDYLKEFPAIFEANLPEYSELKLENDYDCYVEHDLEVLDKIIGVFKIAKEYAYKRPHKSLNLYIWSYNPSFGKTRLLNFLNNSMVAYKLPDDQYYVDYENNKYEVLVSDEAESFLKTKEYSHIKLLFEGEPVEFNRKNRTKVIKKDNPLIVLAENLSFNELMHRIFHTKYQPIVMSTRVMSLELRSRATLHFLLDRCIKKHPL